MQIILAIFLQFINFLKSMISLYLHFVKTIFWLSIKTKWSWWTTTIFWTESKFETFNISSFAWFTLYLFAIELQSLHAIIHETNTFVTKQKWMYTESLNFNFWNWNIRHVRYISIICFVNSALLFSFSLIESSNVIHRLWFYALWIWLLLKIHESLFMWIANDF